MLLSKVGSRYTRHMQPIWFHMQSYLIGYTRHICVSPPHLCRHFFLTSAGQEILLRLAHGSPAPASSRLAVPYNPDIMLRDSIFVNFRTAQQAI